MERKKKIEEKIKTYWKSHLLICTAHICTKREYMLFTLVQTISLICCIFFSLTLLLPVHIFTRIVWQISICSFFDSLIYHFLPFSELKVTSWPVTLYFLYGYYLSEANHHGWMLMNDNLITEILAHALMKIGNSMAAHLELTIHKFCRLHTICKGM